jgi:hypothetical protein
MKKILVLLAMIIASKVNAQNNVGIGTISPNSKAILELKATDKGFIAPRVTTTQMITIATGTSDAAMLVYNIDSACYHFYNGAVWKNLCDKRLDTALFNKLIKNYLNNNSTTIINILKGDTALFNYTTINQANINILNVDTSITNVAIINNATINILNVDTSITNVAIINNATINLLKSDTSILNYATINNAVIDSSTTNYAQINILKADTSILNYANINNAVIDSSTTNYAQINILKADTSILNYATINNAVIDSSTTNYAQINILKADTSILNYATINNAVIDSSTTNYAQIKTLKTDTANINVLNVGGKNIMQTITDSITAQAWLRKGNIATATNKLGTLNTEDLHIVANNIEYITLANTTGNVGIGTTTPTFKLHVPTGFIGTDYINTTDNVVATGVTGIMVKAGDNFLRTGNAASILSYLGITAPTGDNLGNHTATTTLNMNANFITGAQGSSLFAQSSASSTSFVDAPIQLRESQFAGASAKAPRLSFHWAGVVASQIGIETSGRMAILNNPGTGYENLIANETYSNSWFRNVNANTGLYNEVTGTGIFSPSAGVMAIYNNGSLGIGTNTPTAKLDVAGTARIQNLPAGANTESVVTVDGAGNLHKKAAGFTGATYVGTLYSGNTGAPPANPPVTGFFTSATGYVYSCAGACRDVITVSFPAFSNTNYVVICTPVCNSCTSDFLADYSNEIRTPLIYQKTTSSFKLMVEETGSSTQDLTWDIMVVTY